MWNKRPDILILAAVIAAAAVATLAAPRTERPSTSPGWKAVAASGRVESRADAATSWLAVRRGAHLAAESLVRTGSRARTTLVRGASVLLVDPESEVVLPAAGNPGGEPATVFQSSGSVVYRVDGVGRSGFRVETPYLVAGVKGTEFLVSVQGGRASVTVSEGLVEVTSVRTGERHEVGAGETLLVREEAGAAVEGVDRKGLPLGDSTVVAGDVRHLAWKQSRRLAEATRELAFQLHGEPSKGDGEGAIATGGVLSEADSPVESGRKVDTDLTRELDEPLDEPLLDEAGELIEDLANDPLRKDDSTKTTDPPPSP